MKREVLAAIGVGIGIGLVFTYGIWLANKSLKEAGIKPKETIKIAQNTPVPSPSVPTSGPLSISDSVDNLLTNQNTLELTGNYDSASPLIILTENSQYLIPASTSTKFTQKITLEQGYNRIKFINGQNSQEKLVTYSTQTNLFVLPSDTPTPKATQTPNSLRDNVRQQVDKQIAEIRQGISKKAYLGSVNSVSNAEISLTDWQKTSRTITATAETVIRLKNGSEGTLKDLKSSDYLLVMGDADSNGGLLAKRIVVLDPPKADFRQILTGVVKAYTNKTLTVEKTVLNISKETSFQPSKYKFKDVNPGFNVIAIHTPSSTQLIYVLSEK